MKSVGRRESVKAKSAEARERGRRTQRNNSTYSAVAVLAHTFRLARRQRPTRGDVLCAAPQLSTAPRRPHITRRLCRSMWVIIHRFHTRNDLCEDDRHDPRYHTAAHRVTNRATGASQAQRAGGCPPNAKDPDEGAHEEHDDQLLAAARAARCGASRQTCRVELRVGFAAAQL